MILAAALFGASFISSGVQTPEEINLSIEFYAKGRVTVELAVEEAPQTVAHIVELVDSKFYNGIIVHRVAPNFVVQFGNPDTKALTSLEVKEMPHRGGMTVGLESGSHPTTIPFEDVALRHERGTLGLALSAPQSDTGSSHIFINLQDNFRLDGQYVVFGKVTEGMEVIDSIRRGDLISHIRVVRN